MHQQAVAVEGAAHALGVSQQTAVEKLKRRQATITALTIRTFRSIVAFAETTGPLNIFVAQNDEG